MLNIFDSVAAGHGSQPFKVYQGKCAYADCGKSFTARRAYGVAGPWPKYCPGASCATDAKKARDKARPRTYQRCAQCNRTRELRWNDGKHCSALCVGVAALIAAGRSESDAKATVERALVDDPSLAERRPKRASGSPGGFSLRDVKLFDSLEMHGGFGVSRQAAYLEGHLGPNRDYTCDHLPYLVKEDHPWFASNPDWWNESHVPMIRIGRKVTPLRVVRFLNLVSLVSKETRPFIFAA